MLTCFLNAIILFLFKKEKGRNVGHHVSFSLHGVNKLI